MAEKVALVESFLNCHVCSETYRDPVSLGCHHSFCSRCLKKFWEQAKHTNCPICKRKSSKDHPRVDFKLKGLADSFAGRQKTGSSESENGGKKVEVVFSKHPEEPKSFGGVVPIEQAVSGLKELLKSDLKSLQDKRDKCNKVEKTYKEVVQHSKKQVVSTERQIQAEFIKLHQFLNEEEESRLAALREEEKQKGKTVATEMKIIKEQISSLSDSISAVEAELQKQTVPFLSSYKATQTRARELSSEPDPQLAPEALIDVAKHLGNLAFRVWEKIKEKVHFSPVILDPNTANGWLCLSDDLTSVRNGETWQQLPDNPERCTKYTDVIGSEGFRSGKHSWKVEVGDLPRWTIGLAKESVDRKGEICVSPEFGIWCLMHADGKYDNGCGKTVTEKKGLQRIRVQLDYDMGEVSFYDAEDMSLIYTHRDIFTENLFPYFEVGEAGDAKSAEIKIC